MNNIYSLKYIFQQLNSYKNNISINQISRLPFLIRNNGLVLALEYLLNKKEPSNKNVGKIISEYISKDRKTNNLIENLKNMNSYDYMLLQKDVYTFSIKLRSIALSLNNVKQGEEF